MAQAGLSPAIALARAKAIRDFLVKDIFELECHAQQQQLQKSKVTDLEIALRVQLKRVQRLRNQLVHLENTWLVDPAKNTVEEVWQELQYARVYYEKLDLIEAQTESRLERLWQDNFVVHGDSERANETTSVKDEIGMEQPSPRGPTPSTLTPQSVHALNLDTSSSKNTASPANVSTQQEDEENESLLIMKTGIPTEAQAAIDSSRDLANQKLDDHLWTEWSSQAFSGAKDQEGHSAVSPHPTKQLNVVQFSGNPDAFPDFWDKFVTQIHEREGLCPLSKLQLLRHCVGGQVKSALQNINDYPKAVRVLVEHFGSVEHVVGRLFSTMVTSPKPQGTADVARLKDFLETMQRSISLLNMLGLDRLHRTGVTYSALLLRALPDDLVQKYLAEIGHKNGDSISRPDQWALQYSVLIRFKRLRAFVEREIKNREKQLADAEGKDMGPQTAIESLRVLGDVFSYNRL